MTSAEAVPLYMLCACGHHAGSHYRAAGYCTVWACGCNTFAASLNNPRPITLPTTEGESNV